MKKEIENIIKLIQNNQLDEAKNLCKHILNTDSHSFVILNLLGVILHRQGLLRQSVDALEKSIKIKTDYIDAIYNLGLVHLESHFFEKALKCFNRVIKLDKKYVNAYEKRAITYSQLERFDEAIKDLTVIIQLQPNNIVSYGNRGNMLLKLHKHNDAIKDFNKILQLNPNSLAAYTSLCVAYRELGYLQKALKHAEIAINLKPDYAHGYGNRGNIYKDLSDLDNAEKDFKKMVSLLPNDAKAHFNLGLIFLLKGNFKEGWIEYDYRQKKSDYIKTVNHYSNPHWRGQDLEGKSILVTAEQGIGDEVMFASCVPDLIAKKPKQIIIESDPRLKPIFNQTFATIDVWDKSKNNKLIKENTSIDFQIALGSLPRYLRNDPNDFPLKKSFITPNTALVKKWIKRYNSIGSGLKIGISWKGGKEGILKKMRSIDLVSLGPILKCKAHFINLQYGDNKKEVCDVESKLKIKIFNWNDVDPLINLEDFFAQISALDLVISVDNSTVHFAGSLGVHTWALIPASPDFRWMLEKETSLWYKNIRLFRQKQFNNWNPVIQSIKKELKQIIK